MPQNYTKPKGKRFAPDPDKYLFNIDTLYVNLDSHYYNEIMDLGFRDLLIEGREHFSDFSEPLSIPIKIDQYENELLFDILGAQPPAYQYHIRNDSYAFYFAKTKRDNAMPIKIQINQFVLWEKGVWYAYYEAIDILKSLGFMPSGSKLNRVDFACHSDQWKWTIKDIETFEYPKNFKGDNLPNFNKVNPSTLEFGTCYFGDRNRLLLRIYNKSKEIEDKKKYYFYEIYNQKGMDTTNVWNIEFEIHRSYLKSLKEVTDDENLIALYDDWEYCLHNDGLSKLWSHLMDKFSHNSQHWNIVAKGEKNKFTSIPDYKIEVVKDIDSNIDRETAQVLGRLMTFVMNEDDYTFENAIKKLMEKKRELEESGKKKAWLELVEEKKKKIANANINKTIKNYRDELNINKEQDTNIFIYKNLKNEIKKDMLAPMSKK